MWEEVKGTAEWSQVQGIADNGWRFVGGSVGDGKAVS